uniref:Uncharacterized protein n=1 Tax=Nelumbo nucifera TaxID=4432 RepID=A0A822XUB0_NELNU|nr:TPA_asm: hypothetical protein HUJ06_024152 [Nelumbo nucifera]
MKLTEFQIKERTKKLLYIEARKLHNKLVNRYNRPPKFPSHLRHNERTDAKSEIKQALTLLGSIDSTDPQIRKRDQPPNSQTQERSRTNVGIREIWRE